MGRYFKVAQARPVDYMSQLNLPLMEKVIANNDARTQELLDVSESPLTFGHIGTPEEEAKYKEITGSYNDKMTGLAEAIRKDPANWRRYQEPIRQLNRALIKDMTSGGISKMGANYAQYTDNMDKLSKQEDLYASSGGKQGVNPNAAALYRQHWMKGFSGTNWDYGDPSGGKYNTLGVKRAMSDINPKEIMEKGIDKIKSNKDTEITVDENNKMWERNIVTNHIEEVTPEKVMIAAMSNLGPAEMAWRKERQEIGAITGAFDEKGNFISPVQNVPYPMTDREKAAMDRAEQTLAGINQKTHPDDWKEQNDKVNAAKKYYENRTRMAINPKSMLASALDGIVSSNAYRHDDKDLKIQTIDKLKTQYEQGQQNMRHMQSLNMDMNRLNWEKEKFGIESGQKDRDLDLKEQEMWNKQYGVDGKGKNGLPGAGGTVPAWRSTGVTQLSTNAGESLRVNDLNGNPVKLVSGEGVKAGIIQSKKNINSLKVHRDDEAARLKYFKDHGYGNADIASQQKIVNDYNREIANQEAVHNTSTRLYGTAVDRTFNNDEAAIKDEHGKMESDAKLTQDDRRLWDKQANDRSGTGLKKRVDALAAKLSTMTQVGLPGDTSAKNKEINATRKLYTETKQEYDRYMKLSKTVERRMENVYKDIRKGDVTHGESISIGTPYQNPVQDIVFGDPDRITLIDKDGNTGTDIKGVAGKNMVFSGDDNILDYIKKENVKVDIDNVGWSKAAGGGLVARVHFDGGDFDPSKPYFIKLTPEQEQSMGRLFSKDRDPEVKKRAGSFLDTQGAAVRKQFWNHSDAGESSIFNIEVPNRNGTQIPLRVRRINSTGILDISTTDGQPFPRYRVENGKIVEDTDAKGKLVGAGSFESEDDFLDNLSLYMRARR